VKAAGRALRRAATRVGVPVIETIFPSRCWASGVPTEPADGGLSAGAREAAARMIELPYCARCGMTTGPYTRFDAKDRCVNCSDRNLGVAAVARVGTFDPPLSDLVKRLKFEKRWEIAPLMGAFLVQAIQRQATAYGLAVDALVPVPLHWRRRLARGFNQAEEIARAAGKIAGWPAADALRRVKATGEQSLTESAAQRRENLDTAFEVRRPAAVAGKAVWLVDDVCTTGATLHAAAMALRRLPKDMGPARVYAAVMCVTDRTPIPGVTL
jgi:ComF family protein